MATDPTRQRLSVAVWQLVRNERDPNIDRARPRLEGDLQTETVEQCSEHSA
jgi:hypothetical protein